MTVGKEKTDTVGEKDTLLHGETLLVVTAGDTEDVTFEFITERVGGDLLGDPLLVEDTAVNGQFPVISIGFDIRKPRCCALFLLIIVVDGLLFPSSGVLWYCQTR